MNTDTTPTTYTDTAPLLDAIRAGDIDEDDRVSITYIDTRDTEQTETATIDDVYVEEAGTKGTGHRTWEQEHAFARIHYTSASDNEHIAGFTEGSDEPPTLRAAVEGETDRKMGDIIEVEVEQTDDVEEEIRADGGDEEEADPHLPTPIETEQDDGSLLVAESRVRFALSDEHRERRDHTVPAADRQLYDLLMEILADVRVPDLMPARLATTCDDLVDVRDTVEDIDRGSVDVDGAGYGMGYCYRVRDAIEEHRDREPTTLAAVGCSGSKYEVDEPVPAADLYRSGYWTCKRNYGETIGDGWRIISAMHAVLHPETEIDYYERTPDDLRGVPVDHDGRLPTGDPVDTLLDQWALRVYHGLQAWLHDAAGGVDPRDVDLQILLGTRYRDPLEARGVFDALRAPAGLTIAFPFQEEEQAQGGNGNQMGWMSDVVEDATA